MEIIDDYFGSVKIIDMSVDFRLREDLYREYYGEYKRLEFIEEFVYGFFEFYRKEIRKVELVVNLGCNVIVMIFVFYFFREFMDEVIVDFKVSLFVGGRRENVVSIYLERSYVVRVYKFYYYRYEGEVI